VREQADKRAVRAWGEFGLYVRGELRRQGCRVDRYVDDAASRRGASVVAPIVRMVREAREAIPRDVLRAQLHHVVDVAMEVGYTEHERRDTAA
jgi:hypothetical protein